MMIMRNDGNEDWLSRGEQYVKVSKDVHPEQIVVALLISSHCSPKYIEIALDHIYDVVTKSQRVYILSNLARFALANSSNAFAYLNGEFQEKRKYYFCRTLAWGLKRYRQKISGFLVEGFEVTASQYLSYIIRELIRLQVHSSDLDRCIATWLNGNYRKSGYGGMLKSLYENPVYWKRVCKTDSLNSQVTNDFEAHKF